MDVFVLFIILASDINMSVCLQEPPTFLRHVETCLECTVSSIFILPSFYLCASRWCFNRKKIMISQGKLKKKKVGALEEYHHKKKRKSSLVLTTLTMTLSCCLVTLFISTQNYSRNIIWYEGFTENKYSRSCKHANECTYIRVTIQRSGHTGPHVSLSIEGLCSEHTSLQYE